MPKARYHLKNGRDYDAALRRRGDLKVTAHHLIPAAGTGAGCL
jgi:hypothetical protein